MVSKNDNSGRGNQTIKPALFADYAGDDLGIWRNLEGQQVIHHSEGLGRVVRIEKGSGVNERYGAVRIFISFEETSEGKAQSRFAGEDFAKEGSFSVVVLPDTLFQQIELELDRRETEQKKALQIEQERRAREQEERHQREEAERQQKEAEAEDAKHFAALKAKYLAGEHEDESPSSPLYMILQHLEGGVELNTRDIGWLKDNGLFQVLALYHEQRFARSNHGWDVVKASSYWRKAKNPQRALELTERFAADGEQSASSKKFMPAILTTRGGAFRDINNLDEAERCGRAAIQHDLESYYPYSLLGAICYERGRPEEGDSYFQMAQEFGADPKNQDEEIRRAIKSAGDIERKRVAEYLLRKDRERYSWAAYYLK